MGLLPVVNGKLVLVSLAWLTFANLNLHPDGKQGLYL